MSWIYLYSPVSPGLHNTIFHLWSVFGFIYIALSLQVDITHYLLSTIEHHIDTSNMSLHIILPLPVSKAFSNCFPSFASITKLVWCESRQQLRPRVHMGTTRQSSAMCPSGCALFLNSRTSLLSLRHKPTWSYCPETPNLNTDLLSLKGICNGKWGLGGYTLFISSSWTSTGVLCSLWPVGSPGRLSYLLCLIH